MGLLRKKNERGGPFGISDRNNIQAKAPHTTFAVTIGTSFFMQISHICYSIVLQILYAPYAILCPLINKCGYDTWAAKRGVAHAHFH